MKLWPMSFHHEKNYQYQFNKFNHKTNISERGSPSNSLCPQESLNWVCYSSLNSKNRDYYEDSLE